MIPTNAVFHLIRTVQDGDDDGTPVWVRGPDKSFDVWWDEMNPTKGDLKKVDDLNPNVMIRALMIIPEAEDEVLIEVADEGTVEFQDGTAVAGTWRVLSSVRKPRLGSRGNQEVMLQRTIESR